MTEPSTAPVANDFIREIVRRDNEQGTYGQRVQTRFPPEPNGYLHIGHAKAIVQNFSVAQDFGGVCNLRLDDTNPGTEESEYVDAIKDDIAWLGYTPGTTVHASDYFEQLYQWAEHLVENGLAYVDDQDGETISAQRGGFGTPGVESPFRNRPAAESLDLLRRMRAGEFADGTRCLRAKIDMASENMWLRDPVMYRVRHADHHNTGDKWCIYPTYDWAHGQSDAIEGVTHSLCSLEFDSHRALYDWFLAHLPLPGDTPKQIEFARLELTHTITSKRRLKKLVDDGVVDGWDDPRMPTLRGMRRRGYPAAAIRDFMTAVGTTRNNSVKAIEEFEAFVRRELNRTAQRRMAVLHPLKLVLTNWPVDASGDPVVEWFEVNNNPENPADGTRTLPFTGELFIESDDFAEVPPPKFFRLSPGREVRLRGAFLVTATDVIKDDQGNVVQVNATYDPTTRGGDAPGAATGEALDDLNPSSRELLTGCQVEPSLAEVADGQVVQFERLGYFCCDRSGDQPVFHRAVGLKDEWAAVQKRRQG